MPASEIPRVLRVDVYSQRVKSPQLFTRFKNAVTFVPHGATKVQASPVARLAA